MLDKILEVYSDEEILIADGFDDAIIGIDPHSVKVDILLQDGYRDTC